MESNSKHNRRLVILALLLVFIGMAFLAARNWAALGASMANPLRRLVGVERVAQLETLLFNIQDGFARWRYRVGLDEPESPWEVSPNPSGSSFGDTGSVGSLITPSDSLPGTTTPPAATLLPLATAQPSEPRSTAATEAPTAAATPIPTPSYWTLPDIEPYGDLTGEGEWQPYIADLDGDVVAVRTFLQPDPERPYALVAAVAFDLSKTRLRFVLGLEEPARPGGPHGYGLIPVEDRQPGKLLAAFNGGFIAEHGNYGAMADGVVALAARHGLATLVIYEDEEVRIGEWGIDFQLGEDFKAWRQNALMVINDGEINPKVQTGTWVEWGANLDGSIVTLRSSLGISEDNQVLYYFAGPSLSMPVLADVMAEAGVYNGILMDINPTHAHFTAMRAEDGELVAEPLYAEVMDLWVDRYLNQWDQDFFYVITRSLSEN